MFQYFYLKQQVCGVLISLQVVTLVQERLLLTKYCTPTALAQDSTPRQVEVTASRAPALPREAKRDRAAVCDKLIEVFSSRKLEEWRKLIAYSRQWSSLSDSVFSR